MRYIKDVIAKGVVTIAKAGVDESLEDMGIKLEAGMCIIKCKEAIPIDAGATCRRDGELERQWQAIDRGIGYVKGFMPAIWALGTLDERELVTAESIADLEQVVDDLMVSLARVRELEEPKKAVESCGD